MTGEMFFTKNHTESEAGRIVPDLFLFFKKALQDMFFLGWLKIAKFAELQNYILRRTLKNSTNHSLCFYYFKQR